MKSHVAIFPFMSKGHTVPLLHLSRLLLRRHVAVTLFTTPANLHFVSSFLPNDAVSSPMLSIVPLPFPPDAPPPHAESTDKLPSMALFPAFAASTKLLQPGFDAALRRLPHVDFLVSDGFLPWTLHSATKLNIPRLVFYGMGYHSLILTRLSGQSGLFSRPDLPHDEPVPVPDFPRIKLTRNRLPYPFNMPDPSGPLLDLIAEMEISEASSFGILFNSFYDLEKPFIEYWNTNCEPKAWTIGPLCLAGSDSKEAREKPVWATWLDQMQEQEKKVLYVAFGTQAEVSTQQLEEIAIGLERSGVNFLWVVRVVSKEAEDIVEGLKERVNGRGFVVSDWVDQRAVLGHVAVKGFMSHCGWNSVLESTCEGVPMLTWPMMAEQHLNSRMVVEEMGIGVEVEGCCEGVVKAGEVEKAVREMMEGGTHREVRRRVEELAEAARKAVAVGGSSWLDLEDLLQ